MTSRILMLIALLSAFWIGVVTTGLFDRHRGALVFAGDPWGAGITGLLFVGAYVAARRTGARSPGLPLVAGASWFAYAGYEAYASRKWNIRVDLFLIYPVLAIISVVGLWGLPHRRMSNREHP